MKQNVEHGAQPLGAQSIALVMLTSALWGGTPVAVTFAATSLPPVAIAAARFSMGAIFMVFWCWYGGTPMRLGPGQLAISLIAAVLLFVQIATFNIGIDWSNSSHASMLINTFVFWVIAIEHFVTKTDRLTFRKMCGLLLATIGVVLMLTIDPIYAAANTSYAEPSLAGAEPSHDQDLPSLAGDLIMLLSAFLLSLRIIYVKYALRQIEPGKLILWHDIFGVAMFASYSLAFEQVVIQQLTVPAAVGLAYQGFLVAGLCFALQTQLLRKHSASQLSMFSFSTPLFGILFAAALRNDPLSPWLLLAGLCVALGIYLVSTSSSSRPSSFA